MPFGVISRRYRRQMHAKKRQEILADFDLACLEQRARIVGKPGRTHERPGYPVVVESLYKVPLRREEFEMEVRS